VNPEKRRTLADRVADAAFAAQKYVSPVDVMLHIGWLNLDGFRRWQQGRGDCLEAALQVHPERISEAMKLLRDWAAARQLLPSETQYLARTPRRPTLRFNESGDPRIEQRYRTHWISGELSNAARERLIEKANRAPELVVVICTPRGRATGAAAAGIFW
jgi:hypothetical protein